MWSQFKFQPSQLEIITKVSLNNCLNSCTSIVGPTRRHRQWLLLYTKISLFSVIKPFMWLKTTYLSLSPVRFPFSLTLSNLDGPKKFNWITRTCRFFSIWSLDFNSFQFNHSIDNSINIIHDPTFILENTNC